MRLERDLREVNGRRKVLSETFSLVAWLIDYGTL
jgi:hypothetical protein